MDGMIWEGRNGRDGWDDMGREEWKGCEGMDRKAGMELEGRDGMKWQG